MSQNLAINPSVEIVNGKVTTTSLKVAEHFGKRHDHVLRAIENLECSVDFHDANFGGMKNEVKIGNGATRQDKAYTITRDGFMFLAMGFTGKEAAQWKEAYIRCFNELEARLAEKPPEVPLIPARWIMCFKNNQLEHAQQLTPDQVIINRSYLHLQITDRELFSTDVLMRVQISVAEELARRAGVDRG